MPDIPYKLPTLTCTDYSDTIYTYLHIHSYDTVYKTIQIDSVLTYKNFQETLSHYSSMFNWCLGICTVVLAAFTLYSVIKFVIDRSKLKDLEKQADLLKTKFEELNNIKVIHSEHIIQLWLNLACFMKKKGETKFEYFGYMQTLDVLGKDFYKEDLYPVIESNITKRLIELGTYDLRHSSESSCLDEINTLKRLSDRLEKEFQEKNESLCEFIEDLQKLISIRLKQPDPPISKCCFCNFLKIFKRK